MLTVVKNLAPYIFYALASILVIFGLTKKAHWSLYFLVFLLPLTNVQVKMHALPMGKDLIDILLIAMLLGWGFGVLSRTRPAFEKSSLNPIIAVLVIYTFCSLMIGYTYLGSFTPFYIEDTRINAWKNFCILPLLFFLTLNTIKDKKGVWQTIGIMCFTMLLMNYYLIRQLSWYSAIVSRTKVTGTFDYLGPNEIAAFYNQYTVLLIGIYFFMKRGFKKLVLLGIIISSLYCVLFLFSRAAYIGLAIGLFFLFMFKKRYLLIPLVFIVLFWQVTLPQKVQDRINQTTNEFGELDTSNLNRLVVWDESLSLFKQNPIIGIGYGVFKYLGYHLGDTHNIYIKILAEQGVIGLIIYITLIILMFIQGIKLFLGADDPMSKGLGLGFAACIVVLVINNIFGDRWTYTQLSAYLWIFAALVAKLNALNAQADGPDQPIKMVKRDTING